MTSKIDEEIQIMQFNSKPSDGKKMLIATLVVGGISLMVVVGLGEWRRIAAETSAHYVTLIDNYVSDTTIVDPKIFKGAQPQMTQITGSKNITDLETLTELKDSEFTSYSG